MPFLLLMPSYNQARYILDAVRSVLAQDDPDWQLWIVDNSTDETPSVMREFSDPRIHFHHIPQRMDPGSCLNWMLDRAEGEAFSYVHTDNLLHADYVSTMRAALAAKPMGLAYCDMRMIAQDGTPTDLFRRGRFDLARLFSLDVLGVPFAATRALAQAVGGFRANDLADDVRFCLAAYGHAEYVHVRKPLLDYRRHETSRANLGGWPKLQQSFLDLFLEVRPQLLARGVDDPLPALRGEVIARFEDLEWFLEDLWYRQQSRFLKPWWTSGPLVDQLLDVGLVRIPGFSGHWPKPPLRAVIRSRDGLIKGWPWQVYPAALCQTFARRQLWRLAEQLRHVLLPWAYLTLGRAPGTFSVANAGFRSLVAARQIEYALGWTALAEPGVEFPAWIGWPTAAGTEPLLRVDDAPSIERIAA